MSLFARKATSETSVGAGLESHICHHITVATTANKAANRGTYLSKSPLRTAQTPEPMVTVLKRKSILDAEALRIMQMYKLDTLRQKRIEEIKEKHKKMTTIELTDATFKETIGKHELTVVDCWAPWCGPCRMIAPIIDELAKDYADKITFGKLNVDENEQVSAENNITSIPTLLVFKKGKLVDRITGAMPKTMLEPKLKKHI
jgi:thioredoxin 1